MQWDGPDAGAPADGDAPYGGMPTPAQVPAPAPGPEPTGDAAVDEAVRDLADAVRDRVAVDGHHPLETQVVAFEAAHRALQDRLADVEG